MAVAAQPGSVDHRRRPRRRGEPLRRAIFDATLAELAEVGYAGVTMERVAERAHASKASLYRRWPTRAELVVAAFAARKQDDTVGAPDTGTLRGDLLAVLRRAATQLAGPVGQVARGLIVEALRHPDLLHVLRTQVLDARLPVLLSILRRAAARGEACPAAVTARVAGVGPALLTERFLLHGAPVPDEVITDIVDGILLPLARP